MQFGYKQCLFVIFFFFCSSRRRHTRLRRDWGSDVCSSDLLPSGFPSVRFVISIREGRLLGEIDRPDDRPEGCLNVGGVGVSPLSIGIDGSAEISAWTRPVTVRRSDMNIVCFMEFPFVS